MSYKGYSNRYEYERIQMIKRANRAYIARRKKEIAEAEAKAKGDEVTIISRPGYFVKKTAGLPNIAW